MSTTLAQNRRHVSRHVLQERREMDPIRYLENLTDPLFIVARQAWVAARLVWPGAILSVVLLAILSVAALKFHQRTTHFMMLAMGNPPNYRWSGYHRVDVFPSE